MPQTFTLPWPPSLLSGHNEGHWADKSATVKKHREWAWKAVLEAKPVIPAEGDILLHIRFVPPDRRGDRTNFANRCKPAIDGIADGLRVNDSRFLPSYEFAEPEKPGRLEITIGGRS